MILFKDRVMSDKNISKEVGDPLTSKFPPKSQEINKSTFDVISLRNFLI